MNALSVLLVGAGLMVPHARLQTQAQGQPTSTTSGPTGTAPSYVVGPGDVLEVTVLDQADASRSTTVQPDGRFTMPLLGDIEVAGKTVSEIQRMITERLSKDFLVNPQVEVRVREYLSQSALVVGEVMMPGRHALRGNTRLIDLLFESGLKPTASGEMFVQRTDGVFANGQKTVRFRLGNTGGMTDTDRLNSELVLKNGDVVTAAPKYFVTVDGEVAKPGRVLVENDLTLLGVIAESGGLAKFGASKVRIIRKKTEGVDLTGFGPCDGAVQDVCLEVDIKDIRKGKVQDVLLAQNDKVVVSKRRF